MSSLQNKTICFFATQKNFIMSFIERLTVNNKIRIYRNGDDIEWHLNNCDIAFFEWCDDLLIKATKLPKTCPIICRLHSYEAFTDMPAKVDWSKIDRLVFVNDTVKQLVQKQVADLPESSIIPVGVDLDRFVIPANKTYGKKIAWVGYINYKKNPILMLHCFKKIYAFDSGYSLHIAGEHQDPRYQVYFAHWLEQNPNLPIYFDGWVTDMPAWYADKDFILSTSIFESFHQSVAEAMACGVIPLVHDWYGAENVYPKAVLFDDPDACLVALKYWKRRCNDTLHGAIASTIRKEIGFYSQKQMHEHLEKVMLQIMVRDIEYACSSNATTTE